MQKINYNYGKIKNQFVDLKISVKYSDKQIIDAINETKYTKKVNFQSSVRDFYVICVSLFYKFTSSD